MRKGDGLEERDVKGAKRWILTAFCLFLAAALALAVFCLVRGQTRRFTPEKWAAHPSERMEMVQSLLDAYDLAGMAEAEVEALLGPETGGAPTSFKRTRREYPADTTLVYYLGVDFMDDCWLILPLEDGAVADVVMDVT